MSKKVVEVEDRRKPVIVYFNIELDDAGLTVFEFRVYSRIVRLCAGTIDGRAKETRDDMADICGMSRSSVDRALKGLLKRRMIKTINIKGMTSSFSLTDKSRWIYQKTESQNPCLTDMGRGDPCLTDMGRSCLTDMTPMSVRHDPHVSQTWVPKKDPPQSKEKPDRSGQAQDLTRSHEINILGSTPHVSFFHGESAGKKPEGKKKKNGVVRPQKSFLPQDFSLTPAFIEFCKTEAPNINPQSAFNEFCDHARETARQSADWDAALRRWSRRAQDFSQQTQKGDKPNGSHSRDVERGFDLLDNRR